MKKRNKMKPSKDLTPFNIPYYDIEKLSQYLEDEGYFLEDSKGKTEKTIKAAYDFGTDMKPLGEILGVWVMALWFGLGGAGVYLIGKGSD